MHGGGERANGYAARHSPPKWTAQCPRASPSPQRERAFVRPLHSTWSASLHCERHDLVRCEWRQNRWQPFFLVSSEEPSRSRLDECFLTGRYQAPANARPPPSPKFIGGHDIMARPPLISHPPFCFSCSHIRWQCWRKRIRATASSGWVCGRTSLPIHSYWMESEGEPSVQAVQSNICTR